MLEGRVDAKQLAGLARGRMKSKQEQLEQALTGDFSAHHRFQIELLLEDLEQTERRIAQIEESNAANVEP